MPLTNFPGGVSSYGMPVLPGMSEITTGNVFFVSSTAAHKSDSPTHGREKELPFATLDYAIGQCMASNGDVIYVMPNHAETVTASVTLDVAGVRVVGLGYGRSRPRFTGSGAIDVFNVTAADCQLYNVIVIGAAANVTALVNIAAADFTCGGCVFEPGATPLSCITVPSGGHRFHLHDFRVRSTADGPDHFVDFESSASDNWIIENGYVNFCAAGMDNAVFRANADATAGGIIKGVVAIGLDAAALFADFNSSHAVGEGMLVDCYWQHLAAATITDGLDLGGYGTTWSTVGATDGPVRGVRLPATTAA